MKKKSIIKKKKVNFFPANIFCILIGIVMVGAVIESIFYDGIHDFFKFFSLLGIGMIMILLGFKIL